MLNNENPLKICIGHRAPTHFKNGVCVWVAYQLDHLPTLPSPKHPAYPELGSMIQVKNATEVQIYRSLGDKWQKVNPDGSVNG